MNKKIYIIVILAIIVTTLSQTVSFISGEHQFYQSVQDKCTKCHGDIKSQLSMSTNHSSSSCNFCHVKSATNHTNTNPKCQDCHNTTQKLNSSLEAHTDFSSMGSKGCIACHTTYNALVNYSRAEYIDYTITNNYGNWVISNITTIGTMNLSYNAQRKGGDHDIQNVSCRDCHEDIFEAVSLGGHAVVLAKNSTNITNGTQVPYHDNSNTTLEVWCRTCHSRNDANFSTQQHSVRKTTCEECHQAYNLTPHPGNFFANINTVPHLYRSLVCISCHSIGWPAPSGGIHFRVHQEPYFDVTYEIIAPLLITNSTPASDPTTTVGTAQAFSITLNRPADIYWYNDGSEIFRALGVISSSYTSSSAGIGVYNITAIADDGSAAVSRTWNWTVTNQTGNGTGGGGGGGGIVTGGGIITGSASGPGGYNNISGYVFDNNVLALPGVLVQNSSYQNTTNISGYYSITDLPNGTYTFSYSKAGFNTNYSIFTLNGASVENVNVIVYDTTPPASVSNITTVGGNFYINNSWTNPTDADFNYTWFRYDNGTMLQNTNKSTNYLNLTWSPHYTQNISAQTVDTYNNINPTKVWFNATVPDNPPVQAPIGNKTVNEGQLLTFTVNATDADNDTITYGTNATKGTFNTTTGNFSWVPNYGDAGFYLWNFNSSDGYGGIANENVAVTVINVPLAITDSSPVSDPTTIVGSSQTFSITLNRTANIIWYNNGSEAFRVLNVTSATYINSTAGIGAYNITAFANDSYDSALRTWNWTVIPNINGTNVSGGGDGGGGSGGSNNSVSGYVFDNFGLSLGGVLVQNGSYQNTTDASGYYSIANLTNGTYNFSYSKARFGTAYFEFTLNGAVVINANRTLYDNMSAASVSNSSMTTGNFYINNTWVNPVDADFNYTWFRYSNGTTLQNVSKPVNYLNLTWSPHYTQNISAQTVDTSGNVNQAKVWFNTTIPNNAPFQYAIGNKVVNENENLQFNVTATDADNDSITYGTNATKGTFNITTGNFSWTPGYGDAGFYLWNFNSSDGYGGIANENVAVTVISVPLSITSSSPAGDLTAIVNTTQAFGITLNRTANVTWYINNSVIQSNLSVVSANYTNSTAGIGAYNVTVIANDGYYSASRTWNWTVSPQPTYNVSGYVFDNYGSGLGGVLVQNSSYQNTTLASDYYQITGLFNGTYNFSYSKAGFNTGYLGVTINGADNTTANKTIYDTTPPASVSNPSTTTGSFYINNTWVNPADADFNYTWFRYSNGTTLQNISTPTNYLNLTWSPHYTQNISAQTVDNYSNVNQTMIWFNATIPNNAPVQAPIGNQTVYEGQLLTLIVHATDADNDTITYGTNATKGTFNTTTGNFSWIPNYGDAGFYLWNFNSSDGYGGIANENVAVTVINAPLSIMSSLPASDTISMMSTPQTFEITLNRTANIAWYINGSIVQMNSSVISADYTNITAGIGEYNITAVANDSYYSISRTWNWTVIAQPTYNVSGYVFDNYGSGLGGVLVQNGSSKNTTLSSGYYLITGLLNGTYNFSYSKPGFNTGYLGVTVNGADNTSANTTIYDTTPPASVSNATSAAGSFYINNTWTNPMDADFNYTWFRYSNGTNLQNVSSPVSYLNLTWSPHYTQNISAQTVDTYGNINQTEVWFNATIPNNPPVQSLIGNRTVTAGSLLQFNVTSTDADSDPVTYGTNATKGTLNSTTGAYSWQTSSSDAGTYTWYFNSSDSYGGVASETITVTVTVAPPSKYIPPAPANLTSMQGNFWINNSWQAGAGNATDSYNVSVNGSWMNGTTNAYYNDTVGPHGWSNITVWAYNNSDGGSLSSAPVSQSTQVANNAPLQTAIGNKSVDGGQWLNFTVNATDADNDTITYGTNTTKGSFNTTTGNFSWLTTYSDAGTYIWYFNSSDGYGGIASETITITVNNTPLSISSFSPSSDPTTIQGTAQTFNVTLNRNANVTWYMNGTQVQTDTGVISAGYTNSTVTVGTWNVTASATDGIDTVSRTWNWTVNAQPIASYVPSVPTNLQNTSGNFWVNHTWQAGAGNTTDSYNISVNGTWYNGTTDTFKNSTTAPHGWVNITVWAYNSSGTGSLSAGSISQDTQVANNPPIQDPIGNKSVNEGQWLNFTVHATDADNDTITYGTNATKGTFDITTGNYSWLTNYGDAGVYVWYFNSSDGYGGVASETITVTVNGTPLSITNSSPVSDPTSIVGTPQTFSINLNRTANVTWYINGSVMQTNSSTSSANYTNSTEGVGTYNVTAAATDGYYSASKQWNWIVNPQPVYAPSITFWSNSKTNNNSLTLAVNTSETVNFNATANQTITTWNWYQDGVNQNNNYDNFTTSWSTSGTKSIQVNATNSNGTSNTITWNITVQAQPATYIPPSPANITSTTGNFWVNTTWLPGMGNTTDSYNISVNGAWTNRTTNTSVNSSLSAHAWQNVTVYAYNASGGGSLSTSPAMQNTQIPDNLPVQSPIGDKSVDEGQWLNFTVHATDADNDAITYGTNATKGSLNTTTGNFSWLTTYSDSGTYVWYFNSSDGYGGVASETITVTVNNTPLSITSFSPLSDPTTTQGTAQTFNITLNRIANVTWYMNGLQVQTDTGITSASYTNSTAAAGTWNVTASATDGIDTVSRAWNWTINAMPPATYIPADPTNLQNTTGNFWINNTWLPGTGNTTDSYNVSVNGAWHNGITNTYYNNTVGHHGWSNITVWAYNSSGAGSLSSGSVSQNTQVPNNPPVQNPIGNKNVIAGDLLTFTVSTTDADNDTIIYGTNATKGTLNATTGVYSWQTSNNDIGTYIWYFNSSDGYGGVASETITVTVNNTPLSIISSSPVSDPTTTVGVAQAFSIALNRTANVTWYINGSTVQTNSSIVSANYINSTAGVGVYNITATASDGLESASRIWNWTVISQPTYNVSGYVFDNYGSGLGGVLVQNGSYQSNTSASGYYLITGLLNSTYNLSYSKAGFNTGYLEVTINGADNTTANTTIYDTTPPASASNLAATSASTYINWTWIDPSEPDFDHVAVYIDGTFMRNITKGMQFYNASYFMPNSTHTISTRTVDTYGNVNTTWVNNTAATLPDYTYVSSFQNDTGMVSNFSNALNASDGGASAMFSEVQTGGTNQSNRTTSPTKTINAGTQDGIYNPSYLDSTDGLIDKTIPAISATTETGYLMSTPNTGVGGTTYWNINRTQGSIANTTTNIIISGTGNTKYVFRPGTQNTKVSGTPGTVPAGYGWASSTPINGITSAGAWSFQIKTNYLNTANRTGTILAYVYKYNATSGTNTFLFNASGTANHLINSTVIENITSAIQPSYTFNSTEYLKVEYWLNVSTALNNAVITFEANSPTPFVRYSRNSYSLDTTYTFTETNSSATWQSISIQDSSYGDALANTSIFNSTSGQWESILTSAFNSGITPAQHVNIIKGANGNASSYDAGSGQIRLRYNWTGALSNNSLGVDQLNVTVGYLAAGPYHLNITTNTTNIPDASTHTLQLMYNVSGDNFTLQIWNGSAWNNRTTLNDTTLSYRNITLQPEELIPQGISSGYAGSVNNYYVLVRYLDMDASPAQQGRLYLDYQRVYSE